MLNGFDVLNRSLDIFKSYFIEASAGTGKTFAIENLFVRLLLEKDEIDISQILVVTFTKASTLELQERIHDKLETILKALNTGKDVPDYLLALIEQGEKASLMAQRKIQRSLALFETHKIFTIHGFCFHCLQENPMGAELSLNQVEDLSSSSLFESSVKDYLRVGISTEELNPFQVDLVFRKYRNDSNELIQALVEVGKKRIPIEVGRFFKELEKAYRECIDSLKKKYNPIKERLIEDLCQLAPCFSKLCDKRGLKATTLDKIHLFSDLFDGHLSFDPFILSFQKKNLLKKAKFPSFLHYPGFLQDCEERLMPIVEELFDTQAIFAILAEGARQAIEESIKEEELLFFDDLINKMESKCKDPLFSEQIKKGYKAVFIDEFQDTDPKQWTIFSSLFTKDFEGPIYIVGDPKQSIYRFREADIYTYLEAKKHFSNVVSLNQNYRSESALVEGFNHLFTSLKDFIPLPRLELSINCPRLSSPKPYRLSIPDGKESIHFMEALSEEKLFEAIVFEIQELHSHYSIALSECAILVKDRYQAERFKDVCKKYALPMVSKSNQSLLDSPSLQALIDLFEALVNPRENDLLYRLLGGPFFGYNHKEIHEMAKKTAPFFYPLKQLIYEKGFFVFFDLFLDKLSIRERLFSSDLGLRMYEETLQWFDILCFEVDSVEAALHFLKQIKKTRPASELYKKSPFLISEGVIVTTIHMSKGLEYEIVFPIGLILETSIRQELVFDHRKQRLTFQKEAVLEHLQECDAEKMRQFYVAVTRAKKRVYMPLLPFENLQEKPGALSPMHLFLKQWEDKTSLFIHPHLSYACFNSSLKLKPFEKKSNEELTPPKPLKKNFPQEKILSFSTLSKSTIKHPIEIDLPEHYGAYFGKQIHLLLEKLPFEKAFGLDRLSFSKFLEPYLHALSLPMETAHLVYQALFTPLPHINCSLASVNPSHIIKEMEFLYTKGEDGHVYKGFIDIFFEYEGAYYLIDWKTTLVEDPNQLHQIMASHDYYLQASIYSEAIRKYLKKFNKEHLYKGVYYLFLRYLPEGIYFV